MSKITIIITAYKDRGWIPECISSAINQTFKDYDIMFVSDGNPDLEKYCKPSGIPFYCFEKSNYSNLVNQAAKIATGEWIKVLHDDDKLTKRCLRHLWQSRGESDMVYGNALLFKNNDRSDPLVYFPPVELSLRDLLPITVSPVNFEATLIKRETFLEIGGFDVNLGYSEDYDLLIQMLRHRKYLKYCPHNVVWYRYHDRQITGNEPQLKKQDIDYLTKKHMDILVSKITWGI